MIDVLRSRLKSPEEPVSKKRTPTERFLGDIFKNSALAFATVPLEGLAVRRVLIMIEKPDVKPPSYTTVIETVGLRGLFAGYGSRVFYCLGGNFGTVLGVHVLGPDFYGLLGTAVAKNCILPLSLVSNARQNNYSWAQTITFVSRGVRDPLVHLSFFSRNFASALCLIPGFKVRDQLHAKWGEEHSQLSTLAGLNVSLVVAAVMNSFIKPLFTGKADPRIKMRVAVTFPAFVAIGLREAVSMILIFGSTSPKN